MCDWINGVVGYRRWLGLIVVSLAGWGCSGKAGPPQVAYEANVPLDEVADLVKRHMEDKKKPAAKIQDLRAYEPVNPIGFHYLSNEKCVLFYGVPISKDPEAAKIVLAYDKKVPTDGGYVLMVDGTVKTMSAAEFAAAPKAKK